MQLVNHTLFPALAFQGIDTSDREYHVVVLRVTYQLKPSDRVPGEFTPVLVEKDPPNLVMEDRYLSDPGNSSLLCESDLAPYKPKCDVLLTGVAHAPCGKPAAQWPVRLRLLSQTKPSVSAPDLNVLLDKELRIHGPRRFKRSLTKTWTIQPAEPALQVPLTYELSYGGRSVVARHEHSSSNDATGDSEFVLNEVCFSNPLGRGWQHADFEVQARRSGLRILDTIPAPQIELPRDPIDALDLVSQSPGPLTVDKMETVVSTYRHSPAGFGPVGRAWTPRIQKAGSYDEHWLTTRWPNLPRDFDMGYWNGAPEDQQIAYPPSDLSVELLNMTNPAETPGGHLICRLPGHRAAVFFRLQSGLLMAATPVIDTLHIDAAKLQIAVVWRAAISVEMGVAIAEARFERDPARELFRRAPRRPAAHSEHLEVKHG